jgi:hypothetical protein
LYGALGKFLLSTTFSHAADRYFAALSSAGSLAAFLPDLLANGLTYSAALSSKPTRTCSRISSAPPSCFLASPWACYFWKRRMRIASTTETVDAKRGSGFCAKPGGEVPMHHSATRMPPWTSCHPCSKTTTTLRRHIAAHRVRPRCVAHERLSPTRRRLH